MKNLYMIGGIMGVGKTTVCQILKQRLDSSVFLDGDWCWDMSPFRVTPETERMVLENIRFLLNSFLCCSAYENVIFCWVMHEQKIIEDILSGLELSACGVYRISLICTREALLERLQKDVVSGIRTEDSIDRSMERVSLYEGLDTIKIDTSMLSPSQTAARIVEAAKGNI
ncbi:MAG: AAA family ATPase [Lachnospiraceae bacterium]|nr:AAA family ATPase [Lachnospiraceae bacterium]